MFKNITDQDLIAEFDASVAQFHTATQPATYSSRDAYIAADACYTYAKQLYGNTGRNWSAEMATWLKNRSWASDVSVANAR